MARTAGSPSPSADLLTRWPAAAAAVADGRNRTGCEDGSLVRAGWLAPADQQVMPMAGLRFVSCVASVSHL